MFFLYIKRNKTFE